MFADYVKKSAAALAAVLTLGLGAAPAFARDFLDVDITVDLAKQKFDAALYGADGGATKLTSPRQVADGVFTLIDIKVLLKDDATAALVTKLIDEGFEPEAGPCSSSYIGALAMEDGIRYSFDLGAGDEAVKATLFTGSRSTHFANDFFCQYEKTAGNEGPALRVSGFFFVIHRPVKEGVDIQLRPVVPTVAEIDKFLKAKQNRRAKN